jgi:pimeloyl-ACP methyl ester carboxylesterase
MPNHVLPESGAVTIPTEEVELQGDLTLPDQPGGLIVFAHGSGSSRHSSRNRWVAQELVGSGFGTLLFDLLTQDEETADRIHGQYRFNIPLLAGRLVGVTDWIHRDPRIGDLRLGYFGASTGAAAALVAAALRPDRVRAVVSRGGRPDLAGPALARVRAPTLLVVGERDAQVLELNRIALASLGTSEKQLVVVPGASHLFEEPGTLAQAARVAGDWFARFLGPKPRSL